MASATTLAWRLPETWRRSETRARTRPVQPGLKSARSTRSSPPGKFAISPQSEIHPGTPFAARVLRSYRYYAVRGGIESRSSLLSTRLAGKLVLNTITFGRTRANSHDDHHDLAGGSARRPDSNRAGPRSELRVPRGARSRASSPAGRRSRCPRHGSMTARMPRPSALPCARWRARTGRSKNCCETR